MVFAPSGRSTARTPPCPGCPVLSVFAPSGQRDHEMGVGPLEESGGEARHPPGVCIGGGVLPLQEAIAFPSGKHRVEDDKGDHLRDEPKDHPISIPLAPARLDGPHDHVPNDHEGHKNPERDGHDQAYGRQPEEDDQKQISRVGDLSVQGLLDVRPDELALGAKKENGQGKQDVRGGNDSPHEGGEMSPNRPVPVPVWDFLHTECILTGRREG